MASDNKAFAGDHYFYDDHGNISGYFIVYRIDQKWYWQSRYVGAIEPTPFGPYETAEGAYLAAIGD